MTRRGFRAAGIRKWLEGHEARAGSQKALARQLGVNPRTIRGWKESASRPRSRGIPFRSLELLLKLVLRRLLHTLERG